MATFEPPPMMLHDLVRTLQSPGGAEMLGQGIAEVVEEQQVQRQYPISYVCQGWVVREFPDGRLERIAKI